MFLFEIIVWTLVGLVYLGGVFWAFRDWIDMDNLLFHEEEPWNNNEDEHLGV
jgi:hypothetical protein